MKLKPGWITVVPIVHIAKRRIAKLLPLRLEPGRKIIAGTWTMIRKGSYFVRGFGYEGGVPVVHIQRPHP